MNLMSPHVLSKKSGTEQQKAGKGSGRRKEEQLREFLRRKDGQRLINLEKKTTKKLHLQIAQPFQNNLPHHEIAKTLNISSSAVTQYQKKSGESLCAKDKAKKPQYWTLMVFRPSGSTALNTGMILTWKPLL